MNLFQASYWLLSGHSIINRVESWSGVNLKEIFGVEFGVIFS